MVIMVLGFGLHLNHFLPMCLCSHVLEGLVHYDFGNTFLRVFRVFIRVVRSDWAFVL